MREAPKIIVFCCNWSVCPGLQLSTSSTYYGDESLVDPIVTMCSGRVSPELILEALSQGAWGVLVAGCPPGECEHNGNYKARRRVFLLRNLLKQFNIEPERVGLEWFSTGESARLRGAMNDFADKVAELGPIGGKDG